MSGHYLRYAFQILVFHYAVYDVKFPSALLQLVEIVGKCLWVMPYVAYRKRVLRDYFPSSVKAADSGRVVNGFIVRRYVEQRKRGEGCS